MKMSCGDKNQIYLDKLTLADPAETISNKMCDVAGETVFTNTDCDTVNML